MPPQRFSLAPTCPILMRLPCCGEKTLHSLYVGAGATACWPWLCCRSSWWAVSGYGTVGATGDDPTRRRCIGSGWWPSVSLRCGPTPYWTGSTLTAFAFSCRLTTPGSTATPCSFPALAQRVAQVSFAALVMYICMAYGLARVAEHAWASEGGAATQVQANPIPGIPSAHRLVVVHEDHYQIVSADGDVQQIPREPPNAIVQQAMADPGIRGFIYWSRFLYWDVDESTDHWLVTFRDLRYSMPGEAPAGIGYAEVRVPKQRGEAAH